MNNIEQISTLELSKYINVVRKMFIEKGFFEHHLLSTTSYRIENTDTFKVEESLYLRNTPEPDIWIIGETYDKFFWIGSLFRSEKKLTSIHKKEFTVVDFYLNQGSRKEIVDIFVKILEKIEENLNVRKMSKLPIEYVSYEEFEKEKSNKHKEYWLVVTDYPIEESFYDKLNQSKGKTAKFEIYLIKEGNRTEVAVGGNLDENANKKKFIKGERKFLNKKILDKNFIGFGFGVERLIYLYNK